MLVFSLEYRRPIDDLTADKKLDLRKCELQDEEWEMVEQLAAVLKVNVSSACFGAQQLLAMTSPTSLDILRCYAILLALYPQSCNGHTCHGPYR
jgi:hypothetical protein